MEEIAKKKNWLIRRIDFHYLAGASSATAHFKYDNLCACKCLYRMYLLK